MDALLLLSFGGPEGPEDVMPFLENATRGRGAPREADGVTRAKAFATSAYGGYPCEGRMGVEHDLGVEARDLAAELGTTLVRAATPGTRPAFVAPARDLYART